MEGQGADGGEEDFSRGWGGFCGGDLVDVGGKRGREEEEEDGCGEIDWDEQGKKAEVHCCREGKRRERGRVGGREGGCGLLRCQKH